MNLSSRTPTAGFQTGAQQRDLQQRQPAGSAEGQHPLRLPAEQRQPADVPLFEVQLGRRSTRSAARSRSRAPTGTRPNTHPEHQLDAHLRQQPDQRVQLLVLDRQVFINVFTGPACTSAAAPGSTTPTSSRTRARRSTTRSRRSTSTKFTDIDGGPYPSSSQGPIHVFSNATTYVKGRHTFKAGISVEYSGEDDFDQINVNSIPGGTNNQNGQFDFRNSSGTSIFGSGVGIANMAMGLFRTTPRSVSARSRSGARSRPTSSSRIRGSRHAT